MDVALVIRQRLDELDLDQRDLARAARVTESYVSQLLTRKKAPPAPRSEEHTSELQSQSNLVCRLLLEKKKKTNSTFLSPRTSARSTERLSATASIPSTQTCPTSM